MGRKKSTEVAPDSVDAFEPDANALLDSALKANAEPGKLPAPVGDEAARVAAYAKTHTNVEPAAPEKKRRGRPPRAKDTGVRYGILCGDNAPPECVYASQDEALAAVAKLPFEKAAKGVILIAARRVFVNVKVSLKGPGA